jgi:hypothetical protein
MQGPGLLRLPSAINLDKEHLRIGSGRVNERGWIKTKNPNYWRRDSEREAMQRSRQRNRVLHWG